MPGSGNRQPFVGRQRELVTLWERLDAATSGQGGVVLIAGEPGVGKTRLVQELAEQASASARRVLFGRAYDPDITPPYLPIADALADYVQTSPADELRGQLGAGAAEVALVIPQIAQRLPGLIVRPPTGTGDDRYRLFESVTTLLLSIARAVPGGLLLILDDLHWASTSTLLLVTHLARKLAGAPLLLVATYRSVDLARSSPLVDILADISREGVAEHIRLGPLSLEDTAVLVEQTWGAAAPREAVRALHRKTEGNPFFVQEVIRHLQAAGCDLGSLQAGLAGLQVPQGVRQVIGKRLSRLSPDANHLLEACAVLGDGVDFDVLAAVCDGDPDILLDALDEVLAAGMLREESATYHFSHALIRQTINEGLSAPRKGRLHLRAAEAIEQIHADHLDPFLESLALHYRSAGASVAFEKALRYMERAAEAAAAVFAYEAAARHLETALELVRGRAGNLWLERRAGLLTRLGTLVFEGDVDQPKGVAYLEEAVRLYERLGRVEDAAQVHVRLGHYRSGVPATVDVSRALEHFRFAEAMLGQPPVGALGANLYHGLAMAAFRGVQTAVGLAAARRALAIAEAMASLPRRARAGVVLGFHLAGSGQIAEGLARLEQARDDAGRLHQFLLSYQLAMFGGNFLRMLGAPQEAQDWIRRELADLDRSHVPAGLRGDVLSRLGEAHVVAGELVEARRLLGQVDLERNAPPSMLLAARIAMCDGDWVKADTLASQVQQECHRRGNRHDEWHAIEIRARSQDAQGERERAEALLQEALEIALGGGHVVFELAARAELALLAARAGRADGHAAHLLRWHTVIAGGENWRGLAGRIALAEAVPLSAAGRLGEAEKRFEQAIHTFRCLGLGWDEAETLRFWGAALGTSGEHARGAEKLAAARAGYERLGAGSPWLESLAHVEDRFAPTRRAEPRFPDGLTAREVDVLRRLAAGGSNREIAAELVLSPRTVERHVAGIYRKIGARRRADATSYALRHGFDRSPTPSAG